MEHLATRIEAVRQLLADTASARELRNASNAEVLDATSALENLGRLVDALRTVAAGETDTRCNDREADLAASRGCRNSMELLERLTLADPRSLKQRIRLAPHVRIETGPFTRTRFPIVATAFEAGRLGVDTAQLSTSTLVSCEREATADQLEKAEHTLVGSALGETPETPYPVTTSELALIASQWRAFLAPDGTTPDLAERSRGFRLRVQADGLYRVSGCLLPEVAGQFTRLSDALTNPRVNARAPETETETDTDTQTRWSAGTIGHTGEADGTISINSDDGADGVLGAATESTGFGPSFDDTPSEFLLDGDASIAERDDRSADQKRHDALATILGVAARSTEMPTLGGAAPTLLVTVTAEDLARGAGDHTVPGSDRAAFGGGVAWVDGMHTPVSIRLAHTIACTGAIQRVVQDARGRIVSLGTPDRIFNAHQRRAILVRDGGCIIPGCSTGGNWCEIHHVKEHHDGGDTHTDNGVLLCWHHHRELGRNGWHIRMNRGIPEVRPPNWIDPELRWRPSTKSPTTRARLMRATLLQ